jgi:galactose mutarotase-like enzyme
LFPIVGTLADGEYRVADRSYRLPRHGFARHKQFDVLSASTATASLRLRADDQTLAVYPFNFQLQVRFEVAASTITVTTSVMNDGDVSMPASFGYHPAFRWPLPFGSARALHAIDFDLEEAEPIRRLNSAGLLTPAQYPTPIHARRLALHDELFTDDAVILDAVRSRAVSYGANTGPRLTVRFPDTPYLALWSKPGAPFICIEPWHGIADPMGFTGDFRDKPGVFIVPPHAQREIRLQVALAS